MSQTICNSVGREFHEAGPEKQEKENCDIVIIIFIIIVCRVSDFRNVTLTDTSCPETFRFWLTGLLFGVTPGLVGRVLQKRTSGDDWNSFTSRVPSLYDPPTNSVKVLGDMIGLVEQALLTDIRVVFHDEAFRYVFHR